MARDRRGSPARPDPAAGRAAGQAIIDAHPLLAPLWKRARFRSEESADCPADGWAVVSSAGHIALHESRREDAEVWAWVIAHSLLHLGFGHLDETHCVGGAGGPHFDQAWNAASCAAVNRFLAHLKIGRPPAELVVDATAGPGTGDEERLAGEYRLRGQPVGAAWWGTGGTGGDLVLVARPGYEVITTRMWETYLADGLTAAVTAAVEVAGGDRASLSGGAGRRSAWARALSWFISGYPLLGALAAGFTVVEDADVCRTHDIAVAAISPTAAELYLNPQVSMTDEERRFVVAHELLHAGLRHDTRAAGRDTYLYNVAADYVVNDWLVEMGVGELPAGCLHDASLRGSSVEEVYDRIAGDLRRLRKLATLRGVGAVDVLPGRLPSSAAGLAGVDLDEYYRRALADGLEYHRAANRGLLPSGLVEEIRALSEPPVPWDVELARWFDDHFAPLERRRSYARPSRRQSSTPDIPRPGLVLPDELRRRTFAVVLDTSGSMDAALLGRALGPVASYAAARDVPAARVVFCTPPPTTPGTCPPTTSPGGSRSGDGAAPCSSPAWTWWRRPPTSRPRDPC